VKRTFVIVVAAALGGLIGCQTPQSGSNAGAEGNRYVVSSERTAFYERGPAQDYGPDFNLSRGQEVELVQRSYGFSRVKTDIGKVGYVATEDLAPAPPRPDPTPEPASYSSSSSSSEPGPMAPVLDYEDVVTDLPSPEDEPKPVTNFRY